MYIVKDILDSKGYKCFTISPDSTVYEALKIMAGHNIGSVVVVTDDIILGVFSERDYARKLVLMGKTSRLSKVKDLMTDKVHAVKLSTKMEDCMKIMTDHRVRHLPVIDNDERLVGIISIGDVVNKIMEAQNHTINQLEDYIIGKR